jgi:hypothetical protein
LLPLNIIFISLYPCTHPCIYPCLCGQPKISAILPFTSSALLSFVSHLRRSSLAWLGRLLPALLALTGTGICLRPCPTQHNLVPVLHLDPLPIVTRSPDTVDGSCPNLFHFYRSKAFDILIGLVNLLPIPFSFNTSSGYLCSNIF